MVSIKRSLSLSVSYSQISHSSFPPHISLVASIDWVEYGTFSSDKRKNKIILKRRTIVDVLLLVFFSFIDQLDLVTQLVVSDISIWFIFLYFHHLLNWDVSPFLVVSWYSYYFRLFKFFFLVCLRVFLLLLLFSFFGFRIIIPNS